MNKRQHKKQRKLALKQAYDESFGQDDKHEHIHQYDDQLIIIVDRKHAHVTIKYQDLESLEPLPISALKYYIGCWNNPEKMYHATEKLIANSDIMWTPRLF